MHEIRTPKVGDKVAIPKHAAIFIVRNVDEVKKTVDADLTTRIGWIEKDVSWTLLTFLDPKDEETA
jgi:hypothetical protein